MKNILTVSFLALSTLTISSLEAHDSIIAKQCMDAYNKSEFYMSAQDKAQQRGDKEQARKMGTLAKVAVLEFRECQAKHVKQ